VVIDLDLYPEQLAAVESVAALGHVGKVDRLGVIVLDGGSEALPILSAAFCSLDGMSVLTASPVGCLGRTPMTVNGLFVPLGTFYMTFNSLIMTVNCLNMTVNLFFVPLGTLSMTFNFLNMTVNGFYLGHLLRPTVFLVGRLPSSPVPLRAPFWIEAYAGTGQA
jgi:hypothetical protein